MTNSPSLISSSSSQAKARKYTMPSERKMKASTNKLGTALTTTLFLLSGRLEVDAKKALRVFQTLPHEPNSMNQEEMMRSIRATQAMVFGDEDGEQWLVCRSLFEMVMMITACLSN